MDNQNRKDRCVNCGIKSVPLYLGLDGRLHCTDRIGLLLPPNKPEQPAEEELRMQKKEPAGRKNGERRLFSSVNLRMEHIALVEEIALETGRTKTQVLGDMVQFAYDHIELYEEGEA